MKYSLFVALSGAAGMLLELKAEVSARLSHEGFDYRGWALSSGVGIFQIEAVVAELVRKGVAKRADDGSLVAGSLS